MLLALGSATAIPEGAAAGLLCLGFGLFAAATASSARGAIKGDRELQLVRKISALIHHSSDVASLLAAALEETIALIGSRAGCIWLATEHPPFVVSRGLPPEAAAVLQACSTEDEVSDLQSALSRTFEAARLGSYALIPLQSAGKTIGVFGVAAETEMPRPRQAVLETVADLLGVAVANLRLKDSAHKLSEDLIALQEVNKIFSQSPNLEEIIHRIVVEGKRLVQTSHCHLLLVDDRAEVLVGVASTRTDADIKAARILLSESSVAVSALLEKRVIAVDDLGRDERWSRPALVFTGARAAIAAPLITKEQSLGVLIFTDNRRERPFTAEEILRADALAHQAAIALQNANLFQVVLRSQKEWETTFDAMQDCVSVHDVQGRVLRANVALARRLRTSPRHVIGKYCADVYGSAGSSSIPCRHTRSLQFEALSVEELEIPDMGGSFQVAVSPWYDKNNRLAGSIHVAKDISNEKLLRQQLIQSEKLSAIGELISGIAHELNNPLTGVMGYSQLLQLRKDLDDRARESLLKINNLALRCQKIVQNLLSFARKQKPERTWSDVNEILGRTVELRSYEMQVNNIIIEQRLDPTLPKTVADAHQLQQVFLNVITNAEQAMLEHRAEGRLVIRTRAERAKGCIVVEIIDDGPGIPEAHLNKIFDPFFTTKEVGKGTGLGLSLSYGIIKEHGGNIYARSRVDEGATFVIEIPIVARMDDETPMIPEKTPEEIHFENLVRGKRILVVDDEKYILDFFVEVFQLFPLQVDTAGNGHDARQKIRATDYDLIITDFKMPQMSGRELFEWIQTDRPALARRIIFITGDTVNTETRSFLEQHRKRYLAKPFKIDEVKEIIQLALGEETV